MTTRVIQVSPTLVKVIKISTNTIKVIRLTARELPTGGFTGQALAKASDDSFDVEWSTSAGAGDLLSALNLSDVADAATSLANLGGVSSADLTSHTGNTSNPHSVTATQAGALVSIDGVSNAGGNVDLVAGAGMTITPNDGADNINIKLANTAVTPGVFTSADITVDAQGRLTAAASGSGAGVTSVATGDGLTGGPITTTGTVDLDFGTVANVVPATGDLILIKDATDGNVKTIDTDDFATAAQGTTADSAMQDLTDDPSPQLSAGLDVNGQKIISADGGDIDIEPNGTGNVLLGNFTFNADQTVGAGQDNFVLTYDNGTGLINLEVSVGGSSLPVADSTSIVTFGTNKEMRIDVGAVADSTVRVLIMPDNNVDLGSDFATAAQGTLADSALQDITNEALSTLSDVTITAINSGELLKWNGSAWVNNTIAEAGLATAAQGTLADSAVQPTLWDANTVVIATSDDTPVALPVAASEIVGRKSTGNIVALTATELRTIINVEDGADVSPVSSIFTRTGAVVAATSDYDAVQIDVPLIGSPTFTNVEEILSINHSTGWVSGGAITVGTDITKVDVAVGVGFIKATDSDISQLLSFDWPLADELILTDANLNFIYAEYNAGTPQIVATTSERTDFHTNVLLGTVFREGSILHITPEQKHTVGDHASRMIRRLKDTMPFAHNSGGVTTETGTRNLAISAGSWWEGLTDFTTSSVDTSVAGRFIYYFDNNAGGFTAVTDQSQINNTEYDNGSGSLATLDNNKYGVHWIYVGVDSDIYIVYGTTNGTLGVAEDAVAPSNVPAFFDKHARLIAKVIILKSASSFTDLTTAFETSLTGSTGIAKVEDDAAPKLGGNLDVNGNEIISISGTDIDLHSDNDVVITLGDAAGVDDFRINDSADVNVFNVDSNGNLTLFGLVDGIDIATDVAANTAKVTNATHTGDVTGATALTIANSAVTNAKMADMVQDRIKGRATASTGAPEDMTAAQVRTMINVEDGSTADQSAAEILTAIKTVDGTGSGLDADLLDGSEATAFATSAQGTLADSALQDITSEALSTLSDVTITAIASGELLKWNGSAWVNNTILEAGLATSAQGTLADNALPNTGVGLVEIIPVAIDTGANGTVTIVLYAYYAFDIDLIRFKTASGDIDMVVKIDGTDVTGMTALDVNSTEGNATASAANSVAVGNTVDLVFTNDSTAVGISVTLQITRT